MKLVPVFLAAALALAAQPVLASDCGCYTPPKQLKVKSNAGVGNGAEVNADNPGPYEDNDVDPGNSQANNQAGNNVFKPNSPNALSSNVIP